MSLWKKNAGGFAHWRSLSLASVQPQRSLELRLKQSKRTLRTQCCPCSPSRLGLKVVQTPLPCKDLACSSGCRKVARVPYSERMNPVYLPITMFTVGEGLAVLIYTRTQYADALIFVM